MSFRIEYLNTNGLSFVVNVEAVNRADAEFKVRLKCAVVKFKSDQEGKS